MPEPFDLIAAKLEENEKALSDLYAQFARTFPQDSEFWSELSRDEVRHAGWIDRVRQDAAAGAIRPGQATARPQAVDTAIQYAASLAARCRKGDLTRVQAHALARDIENTMLEQRLFVVLGLASPELATLQDDLRRETAEHRDRIGAALARLVQRGA